MSGLASQENDVRTPSSWDAYFASLRDFELFAPNPSILPVLRDHPGRFGVFPRGQRLSLRRGAETYPYLIIIFRGMIAEETRRDFGDHSLRFFSGGDILGDTTLFYNDPSEVRTRFLTETHAAVFELGKLLLLASRHQEIMWVISRSLARKLHQADAVYGKHWQPAVQRVANLLWHLGCGRRYPEGEDDRIWSVEGPSQADLASALSLSRASVENALRELRQAHVVSTQHRGYRLCRLSDLRALALGLVQVTDLTCPATCWGCRGQTPPAVRHPGAMSGVVHDGGGWP